MVSRPIGGPSRSARSTSLAAAAVLVLAVAPAVGCHTVLGLNDLTDRQADAGPVANNDAVGTTISSKGDLLLEVDDSASMGPKAAVFADLVASLVRKLAVADDMHIGVITTSLGSMGGDVCAESTNRRAHLVTRTRKGEPVARAAGGFLQYGGGSDTTVDGLIDDTQRLVIGAGESGCGLEAQLESTYRFLVQPDPWLSINVSGHERAEYVGIDSELIDQRKAFLRPDSLVVVVLVTDEDDSAVDPRSARGLGWGFMANKFPGTQPLRPDAKPTMPLPTSACATDPRSPDCTSCALVKNCDASDAACARLASDTQCMTDDGLYGPTESQPNLRFFRMKQRFGIDPQFPISRYVDGFTKERVPNRDDEHPLVADPAGFDVPGDYLGAASCTNPLFAESLPAAGEELCRRAKGRRGKELVLFAVLGGVPNDLIAARLETDGTSTSAPDWPHILGADPASFDFRGQDPHMVQSIDPRPGLPPPSSVRGDNGKDPTHGREWTTRGNDLQYACTFALPLPLSCTSEDPSCDCAGPANPPLCGPTVGAQLRAKVYPTIRELRVVQGLGERGFAGTLCPVVTADPFFVNVLADRAASRIAPRVR